ncbi:hypothetical protein [Mesorhizobium sp. A556]
MAGPVPKFNDTEFAKTAGDLVGKLVKAQQEAVNSTGTRVLAGLRTRMEELLDRPTRFTLNAFGMWRARGRHTDAAILIKPIQEEYLRYVFEGGRRKDDVIPSKSAKLNKFGNMTRNYTRGIVARKGFWKTAKSGVRTLFIRKAGGGIEAVAFRVDDAFQARMDPVFESRVPVGAILPEEAAKAFEKVFAKD